MKNDKNNIDSQSKAQSTDLYHKLCELDKILADPKLFQLLQKTAAGMDNKTAGKVIIDGWSDGLTIARNGITNLIVITSEAIVATNDGRK